MLIARAMDRLAQGLGERGKLSQASGAAFGVALGLLGKQAKPVSAHTPSNCCDLATTTRCAPGSSYSYVWACCDEATNQGRRCYENYAAGCAWDEQIGLTC